MYRRSLNWVASQRWPLWVHLALLFCMETNWKLQCSLQEANPKCEICSSPHVYTANKWYLDSTKMAFLVIWHLPAFYMYNVGLLFKYNMYSQSRTHELRTMSLSCIFLRVSYTVLVVVCRRRNSPGIPMLCTAVSLSMHPMLALHITVFHRTVAEKGGFSIQPQMMPPLCYWCLLNGCMLTWHTNYIHTLQYSLYPGKSMCAILCIHASWIDHIPEFSVEIFINNIKHSNWQAYIS